MISQLSVNISTHFDGEHTAIITGCALCTLEDGNPKKGQDSIIKLLKAVDEHIPTPVRELDMSFLIIENTSFIKGRGTAATGGVERGAINSADEGEALGHGSNTKTAVTGNVTMLLYET